MDNLPEGVLPDPVSTSGSAMLSYDDTVAYEEQLPTAEEAERAAAASLAKRIGSSKVYLLSESSAAASRGSATGKRKHSEGPEDDTKMDEDDEMGQEDLPYRPNAILLTGSPIAHLPTTRIFAYATHFDAHPLGLEWVDDTTCVLVFDSRKSALDGFSRLQKSAAEEPDMLDECVTARPFPIALWPPEERIKQSVGAGEGLKGAIRMRWARRDDVKKKGAMRQSEFYRRHGAGAGKEVFNGRDLPAAKRRRREDGERGTGGGGAWEDEEAMRARLDEELDSFLKEDSTDDEGRANGHRNGKSPAGDVDAEGDYDDLPPSPPSKMRSDYIADDGRTLIQRTSAMRVHKMGADYDNDTPLASRLTKPLPRRARRSGGGGDDTSPTGRGLDDRLRSPPREKLEWGRTDGDGRRRRRAAAGDRDREKRSWRGGGGRSERPKKTQQELDDELDAFLRAS